MPFIITSPCVGTQDRSCVEACPVDCIHFEAGVDAMLYINPVDCIDCGACVPACPVSAIFPEAEVAAAEEKFININSLWYQDAAAARAQVGSDVTPAVTAEMVSAETASAGGDDDAAGDAALSYRQVAASDVPPAVVHRPGRSPVGFVSLVIFSLSFFAMVMAPGPSWIEPRGTGLKIGATILLLGPIATLSMLMFIISQWSALSVSAAASQRNSATWRAQGIAWRRSEESRRADLADIVNAIAADRFAYPNDENSKFRTYVNLPEPQMAVEVQGGGDKLLPDILVLDRPGGRPKLVAQVESRETLSREQAEYVWSQLQFDDAPLLLYVPAGLAAQAKDYARAAGIKNARIRTWRRQPQGVRVREVR
jgi:NAD-dependent dihydropyrimidine dehydrogenase PreA subunit